MAMMDKAIGIAVLVIVVAGVGIPVAGDVIVTELTSVTNETISSSGSTPETLTLDKAEDGVADNDNLVVFFKNAHDGSTFEVSDANYSILPDYTTEDINISDTFVEANSTADQYNVTYDGKPEGYQGGTIGLILPFVIVAMGLALLVAGFQFAR